MPPWQPLWPPLGGGRGTCAPRRVVFGSCAQVERTGGVSRAADRREPEESPCTADSPRLLTTPEPAGQRAFPSSYNRPQDASTDRFPMYRPSYRPSYRPETVRHPSSQTGYETYSITLRDQGLCSPGPSSPSFCTTNQPPKVPLGGSLFPAPSDPSFPFACLSTLARRFFFERQQFVDEVTRTYW